MKNPGRKLLVLAGLAMLPGPVRAAGLVDEPFDYAAADTLTSRTGGTGWAGAWTQDGASCVISSGGLAYTDSTGNVLTVSGRSADTTGTATTRNFRTLAAGPVTNVWISFLYQLPAGNLKFEGVSFYRGSLALFSVSSPSTDSSATISLVNSMAGGSVSTRKGTLGTTHFVTLHLTEGAGPGGTDLIEAFIDPQLSATPSLADGTISASNFDFDTVRLAGQDGSTLKIDEIRVGDTFSDVSPHTTAGAPDSDGDGLTDAQETVLGLNPAVTDAALITAIQSHPDYFGLYDSNGMLGLGQGGVVLPQTGDEPVNLTFEIQHSPDLLAWPVLETYNRNVILPEGKHFLRITLENH